jgi:hypothetical protein
LLPRRRPWRRGEAAGRASGSAEESGAAPSRFVEAEEERRAAAHSGGSRSRESFGRRRAKRSNRRFLIFVKDVGNVNYYDPEGVPWKKSKHLSCWLIILCKKCSLITSCIEDLYYIWK